MTTTNQKKIESLLALSGQKRFEHFVKVVADWEEVWGLFHDGWALAANDNDQTIFPIWPSKEFAQLCAIDVWLGYEPRSIELNDFMQVLLPKLEEESVLPGVFFTPTSKGVTPSISDLRQAIVCELTKY